MYATIVVEKWLKLISYYKNSYRFHFFSFKLVLFSQQHYCYSMKPCKYVNRDFSVAVDNKVRNQ